MEVIYLRRKNQTYLAMDEYRIDNVRGGCYSAIKLLEYDKKDYRIHSFNEK